LKDGCKEAIVFANQIGSPIAVRADTFKKTFEAGGGKVDEISHVGTTANAHIEATKNLLAAHPGVDCIYGVSVDYALGAYQVTSQMANGKNIKLYSNDITPDSLQYLKDGKIQGLNGAHWTCMYFSTALLINAIDGHRTLDASGKPIWATVTPIVITPKTVDLYQKCFIDQLPFNYNDIKNLLYRNNTNVTAQDFTDAINNYSFESVVKNKLAQGVVTQADVTAAGITLK
jgi:ABC-type sugar transport system, periplasmic component